MKRITRRLLSFLLFFICFSLLTSAVTTLTLDTVPGYKNWGWEALVIQNEYITVAIVPEMGGNILQYDFGADTHLMLEPATFGVSYNSGTGLSPFDGSWGFGGYEIWPTPEAWPPPPNLTYRNFSYVVETYNSDSICVRLTSETETETFPGLQFERRISVYSHSTRVKVENTIINHSDNPASFGMMDVNYVTVSHESRNDYENFPVSFPINPASQFGNEGVYFDFDLNSPSYLGQINPGIYSVEYSPHQAKVFADVSDGWGGYVDKRDSQAYVRIFNVYDGESYPDDGARFEVYISPDPHFMAIEVMSPIKNLAANGGHYTFEDNLYSAKLNNTILKATHAGASIERLSFDSLTNKVTGTFGVFNKEEVQLTIYDADHNLLSAEQRILVYPDTVIVINEEVDLPPETNFIALEAYDADNTYVGMLDEIDFTPGAALDLQSGTTEQKLFTVKNTVLRKYDMLLYRVNITTKSSVVINIIDPAGRVAEKVFNGVMPTGAYDRQYQIKKLKAGIYFVVFSGNGNQLCYKIIMTN